MKNMRERPLRLWPVLATLVLAGCLAFALWWMRGGPAAPPAGAAQARAPGRLAVCASLFPLCDWASHVAGPDADVMLLTGGGADPHQFAPSLEDLTRIARARVLLVVGLGLDPWARRAVESGDGRSELWEAGAWVSRRRMEPAESKPEGDADGEHAEHAGHVHGASGEDPHIWLDPLRAAEIVTRLGEEFARLDPAHAPAYRARARAYADELHQLAAEIASAGAPVKGKQVVVFHDAYGYLFDRLGLKVAGVIQLSPGLTPSPRDVAQAVRKMRGIGQRHVFVEAEYQAAARPVAEALGGKVVLLDHLTLREVPWGKTYLERLRYDVKALTENLP